MVWGTQGRVNAEENAALMAPFTLGELEAAIWDTRSNMVSSPDGFSVSFYKRLWPLVCGGHLFGLLDDFTKDRINMKRLNFAALTLLPKVADAECIHQFQPIASINVAFRLLVKGFAM